MADASGGPLSPGISGDPEKAKSFLDFCYQPELATEATLQPIRRFGFDAAIIFSDILVIPDALGQPVKFVEGEGPRLEPLPLGAVSGLDRGRLTPHLAPVYTALREVRSALAPETALIGFAGAPWTLATYMVAGKGTPDQAFVRKAAYAEPERFQTLIDVLVDAVSEHLINQVKAGADALQIFDSWAGNLDGDAFMRWTVAPIAEIVRRVKAAVPGVPIIGFPRGGGTRLMAFARETAVDAVGLDWTVSLNTAAVLQHSVPVQATSIRCGSSSAACSRRGPRRDHDGARGRAVRVQSRPRHPAGDADRPCRTDDRAGPSRSSLSRRPRPL